MIKDFKIQILRKDYDDTASIANTNANTKKPGLFSRFTTWIKNAFKPKSQTETRGKVKIKEEANPAYNPEDNSDEHQADVTRVNGKTTIRPKSTEQTYENLSKRLNTIIQNNTYEKSNTTPQTQINDFSNKGYLNTKQETNTSDLNTKQETNTSDIKQETNKSKNKVEPATITNDNESGNEIVKGSEIVEERNTKIVQKTQEEAKIEASKEAKIEAKEAKIEASKKAYMKRAAEAAEANLRRSASEQEINSNVKTGSIVKSASTAGDLNKNSEIQTELLPLEQRKAAVQAQLQLQLKTPSVLEKTSMLEKFKPTEKNKAEQVKQNQENVNNNGKGI